MKPVTYGICLKVAVFVMALSACSVQKQVARSASRNLLDKPEAQTAHIGIAVYDVAAEKFLYQYNSNKYFIPASNTKLFTCYAAMKYLGDSLPGLKYQFAGSELMIQGTGDPSFLLPDFKTQSVYDFLKSRQNINYVKDEVLSQFEPLGKGWSWDDYNAAYMPERSEMPVYGNVAEFYRQADTISVMPGIFLSDSIRMLNASLKNDTSWRFRIDRSIAENKFYSITGTNIETAFTREEIPFKTSHITTLSLLEDTLHKKINTVMLTHEQSRLTGIVYSQPTDSLLRIMMHRSDNFFAEQTLLMVSNKRLDIMSEKKIIDTLLKTELKALPQPAKWVDGSGLSRYNLFTPEDFVFLLNKLHSEFEWKRITTILPTGGTGTISNYYKNLNGRIFAKTGTLSNNVALSGYLMTAKNKTLLFSVLVNNHMADADAIRKYVEAFLTEVAEKN